MNYPYPTDILSIVPREKDGWQHGRSLVKFSLTSSLKNAVPAAFFILPEKWRRPGKKAGDRIFPIPCFFFLRQLPLRRQKSYFSTKPTAKSA